MLPNMVMYLYYHRKNVTIRDYTGQKTRRSFLRNASFAIHHRKHEKPFDFFFGFFIIYTVLGKTAGLRSGLRTVVFVVGAFWIFRYFGITLYFSTYLAEMHSGEAWFESILALLMILNVWLGIIVIVICFKGNLLKNLLLEAWNWQLI